MSENLLNSLVTSVIQVSPSMRIIRIKPDEWNFPQFKAGQFVVLGLYGSAERAPESTEEFSQSEPEKLIKRAYSIASSSTDEYIEFYISLVRSGSLTPRLFNLEIGERVYMSQKPTGMFTLEQVDENQNVVLIATGTGVAPYMSMLRTDALHRKGNIVVVQGASNSWDLGYFSELKLLDSMFPKFTYYPTITEPDKEPAGWSGDTRFIESIWKDEEFHKKIKFEPKPENTHIFLCGNPKMIHSMKETLYGNNYKDHTKKEPGQIHAEEF
ncbi:MAG: ferredoxin--NADP reductase [Deltaproteobacteria bacterium]